MSNLTDLLEFGRQAHPRWPVDHDAGRALARLRAGKRPLLLARGAGSVPYRHGLVPTDLSPSSLEDVRLAIHTLAPSPGWHLTLLHAWPATGLPRSCARAVY